MADTYSKTGAPVSTPEETEFEMRAHIGAIWTGGRLFIGMYTFLLASLAFSYFYLRSSNNGGLWRIDHQTAPTAYGWTIYGLTILTAGMALLGRSRLKSGGVQDFLVAGWIGIGAGLLGALIQILEFIAVPFFPGASGYTSTFIGYAVINVATLIVSTFWLETTVARAHRLTRELGNSAALLSSDPEARSWRANVASMSYFWGFLAIGATLFTLLFYVF